MKNKLKNIAIVLIATITLTISLSGCIFGFDLDGDSDVSEVSYRVLNENYFKFDTYDQLEVVVSENERFILYNCSKDGIEPGMGEWIKGDVSVPVLFSCDGEGSALNVHGDFRVWYNKEGCRYIEEENLPDITPYIAKINNDSKEPELRWWVTGDYSYNDKYGEPIRVKYNTSTRKESDKWSYIPEAAYSFYSVSEQDVVYVCEEGDFEFDGATGEGIWTVNEHSVPIRVVFDEENFSFSVFCIAEDGSNGEEVFIGAGLSVDENIATYNMTGFPVYYGDTQQVFVIKKISR